MPISPSDSPVNAPLSYRAPVRALSRWFERVQRPLPWRQTRDPYSIWISEVMLQQTQVATVIPYYHRFLEAFPTLEALAAAPTTRVLELWSGLGYYSRARNLQKGAQYLRDTHDGVFPITREAILEVPGIGPYTAGAILSIAFDLPVAIVDGNVQRVLTRYHGWDLELEKKQTHDWLWQQARAWVEKSDSPRILNQALMELGATVCRKETPDCAACPLNAKCVARLTGRQAELPARKPRRKAIDVWWSAPVLMRGSKVFLVRRPKGEWWEGLWTVPHIPLADSKVCDSTVAEKSVARYCADEGIKDARSTHLGEVRHTVTHHRLHVLPTLVQLSARSKQESHDDTVHLDTAHVNAVQKDTQSGWFELAECDGLALSSLSRKILRSVASHAPSPVTMLK